MSWPVWSQARAPAAGGRSRRQAVTVPFHVGSRTAPAGPLTSRSVTRGRAVRRPRGDGSSGRSRRSPARSVHRSRRDVALLDLQVGKFAADRGSASMPRTSWVPSPERRRSGSTATQNIPTRPSWRTAIPTASDPIRRSTRALGAARTPCRVGRDIATGLASPPGRSHSPEAWSPTLNAALGGGSGIGPASTTVGQPGPAAPIEACCNPSCSSSGLTWIPGAISCSRANSRTRSIAGAISSLRARGTVPARC